jgi:hypothetical protein
MSRIKYVLAALLLLVATSRQVTASNDNCSYSKSLQAGKTAFDIRSIPVSGCAVQIISVAVRRGGKKVAGMKADVDYLVRSVKAADLTGDGTPELAVFSRTTDGMESESLDVYWMDGTNLRRAMVPELDDKSGYRGGDRFTLDGRKIFRTMPVYRAGDQAGKATGGTRLLKYEFRGGGLTPFVQEVRVPALPVETKPVVPAAAVFAVTGVSAVEAGIEIGGDGPIEKFKVMKLVNPERIVIDIPDADSSLARKVISINRFGISDARVGRNKGFLRVVLDTTPGTVPKYRVSPSAGGMLVEFTQ